MGFSKAVRAGEGAAAVVALNTCQHVPAFGERERERAELKIESRRKIGQRHRRRKTTTEQTCQLSCRLKQDAEKKGEMRKAE